VIKVGHSNKRGSVYNLINNFNGSTGANTHNLSSGSGVPSNTRPIGKPAGSVSPSTGHSTPPTQHHSTPPTQHGLSMPPTTSPIASANATRSGPESHASFLSSKQTFARTTSSSITSTITSSSTGQTPNLPTSPGSVKNKSQFFLDKIKSPEVNPLPTKSLRRYTNPIPLSPPTSPSAPVTNQTCTLCYDEVPSTKFHPITVSGCKHTPTYCDDCVANWLTAVCSTFFFLYFASIFFSPTCFYFPYNLSLYRK
jgi:hypothetical protein